MLAPARGPQVGDPVSFGGDPTFWRIAEIFRPSWGADIAVLYDTDGGIMPRTKNIPVSELTWWGCPLDACTTRDCGHSDEAARS